MEYISCPICDTKTYISYKTFKIKENIDPFNLVKCKCDLIYLNPRPDDEEIKKYYHSEYLPHTNKNTFSIKIYKFLQKITFFWKFTIIKKNIPIFNKVLDIGGGKGEFSTYLNKNNISTINFEPNLEGDTTSLDNYVNKNIKFDLIMFWHSIEHIHSINSLLETCNKLLTTDGSILIAIPNHDAYERKYFGESWVAYDLPRHLYHFNFKTFKSLITKHNFTIKNYISMYQDTFFNILLSFKSYNFIKLFYILVASIFNISFNKKKSSSLLYICRKS